MSGQIEEKPFACVLKNNSYDLRIIIIHSYSNNTTVCDIDHMEQQFILELLGN